MFFCAIAHITRKKVNVNLTLSNTSSSSVSIKIEKHRTRKSGRLRFYLNFQNYYCAVLSIKTTQQTALLYPTLIQLKSVLKSCVN